MTYLAKSDGMATTKSIKITKTRPPSIVATIHPYAAIKHWLNFAPTSISIKNDIPR